MDKFDRLLDEPNWKDRAEKAEAQLDAVRDCQTYIVELDDCEMAWFKKDDVLKAIGGT